MDRAIFSGLRHETGDIINRHHDIIEGDTEVHRPIEENRPGPHHTTTGARVFYRSNIDEFRITISEQPLEIARALFEVCKANGFFPGLASLASAARKALAAEQGQQKSDNSSDGPSA